MSVQKKSVLLAKVSHGQPENTTVMGFCILILLQNEE